ncbi:hypothetical protein C8Q80DRAFT_1145716 [Daedaleopsis nitida]|nr:hypothetical protein C8Q80DRAFT_1145716 [Daedaleopsis nitida]
MSGTSRSAAPPGQATSDIAVPCCDAQHGSHSCSPYSCRTSKYAHLCALIGRNPKLRRLFVSNCFFRRPYTSESSWQYGDI